MIDPLFFDLGAPRRLLIPYFLISGRPPFHKYSDYWPPYVLIWGRLPFRPSVCPPVRPSFRDDDDDSVGDHDDDDDDHDNDDDNDDDDDDDDTRN